MPNDLSTENTDDLNIVVDLISDVVITLTTTKNEVEFEKAFGIKCVAEGGRIPFYMELTHTAIGSSTPTQIVLYDKDNSSAGVVVNTEAQTLTFNYRETAADYGDIGDYKCTAKNLASDGTQISKEESVSIVVGLYSFILIILCNLIWRQQFTNFIGTVTELLSGSVLGGVAHSYPKITKTSCLCAILVASFLLNSYQHFHRN